MSISKTRSILRTLGGLLFSVSLLLLLFNFDSVGSRICEIVGYLSESLFGFLSSIISFFPKEIQGSLFKILKVVWIALVIVILFGGIIIVALSKGNLGGPGIDIAIRELFRKRKKRNIDEKKE